MPLGGQLSRGIQELPVAILSRELGIHLNAKVVVSKLIDIGPPPRRLQKHAFSNVRDLLFLGWFNEKNWVNYHDRTARMAYRLTRIGPTYHLTNSDEANLFTFANQRPKSCDKEVCKFD
ncbi:hypothetical protein YALI2_D00351g [Yarrowia lipolytica]|nr:hypothetical protein YALI2_D00351g [Yarrowia lipolytica]